MNDFDLARADFQKLLQLYPSNKAAKAQLAVCQQRIRKQLEREKKLYANMFERLAGEESKVRVGTGAVRGDRDRGIPSSPAQPGRALWACAYLCRPGKPGAAARVSTPPPPPPTPGLAPCVRSWLLFPAYVLCLFKTQVSETEV